MGPLEIKGIILVLGTIGGIVCIVLGYRLYVRGVLEKGSGTAAGAGFEVSWKDYGPGVAFAAFGALLIVFCVTRTMTSYSQRDYDTLTGKMSARDEYQGAASRVTEMQTGAGPETTKGPPPPVG
jgi:hypothetical protein